MREFRGRSGFYGNPLFFVDKYLGKEDAEAILRIGSRLQDLKD